MLVEKDCIRRRGEDRREEERRRGGERRAGWGQETTGMCRMAGGWPSERTVKK